MKVSAFVTKIILRIFFVLLFAAMVPFFQGDQARFKHIFFSFHHWWEMIFPCIIIIAFIVLLAACAIKRFKETQLNWLMVVSTIVLMAYGIAIYIRVFSMVH